MLATETQNRMLRYQISPHFLFNTLNALATLVMERQNDRAEQMILGLSGFLRRSLERDVREMVTLAEELDGERRYVAIEQIHFGERLRYVERAQGPGRCPGAQPDPAADHRERRQAWPGAHQASRSSSRWSRPIRTAGCRSRSTDDGAGAIGGPPGLGVGLENVRRRLETRYGDQATLDLRLARAGASRCGWTFPWSGHERRRPDRPAGRRRAPGAAPPAPPGLAEVDGVRIVGTATDGDRALALARETAPPRW